MKVQEYLEKTEWKEVSFIISKAVKMENTSSHFRQEYKTSKLYRPYDDIPYNDYFILNDKVLPLDWLGGAAWGNAVKGGWGKCLLIISWEEITKLYSEKQSRSMIEYIDKKLKEGGS